jgi:hypothetical protein
MSCSPAGGLIAPPVFSTVPATPALVSKTRRANGKKNDLFMGELASVAGVSRGSKVTLLKIL